MDVHHWLPQTGQPRNPSSPLSPFSFSCRLSLGPQLTLQITIRSFSSPCRRNFPSPSSQSHKTRSQKFPRPNKTTRPTWLIVLLLPCRCGQKLIDRTKTPCLDNGNHTYRLTHTRFLPPQTPQIPPRVPPTTEPPKAADTATASTTETAQSVPGYRGFCRDQSFASQIIEVIGQGPWEKKVSSHDPNSSLLSSLLQRLY